MQKRSILKQTLWLIFGSFIVLTAGLACFLAVLELQLPSVAALKDVHLQVPLRIFTNDGELIAEYGNIRRIPITLDQAPKQLIQATLATEDQRFFEHSGVDVLGLGRAAIILFVTGKKKEGGSTITMQVARNYFLSRKKTYIRKIREILLALKIDRLFSKDKILELYYNKIFYGNRAYGAAAAAQIYYGKKLDDLTLPEIAMLAGLPKAPSILNPLTNPIAAKNRRNHVLYRMYMRNYIDLSTYQQAIAVPITAKYHGLKVSIAAPYVAEMVRKIMVQQFGNEICDQGYDVYTTLDSRLQKIAAASLRKALLAYDHRHGYRAPEKNFGAVNSDNFDSLIDTLKNIPDIGGLQPAIVISVDQNSATILLKTGQTALIPWDGLSWARRQVIRDDQEYLGPMPVNAADILKAGDLIRVQQKSDNSWTLAQIPDEEGALVALNPKNGAILALSGGFSYFQNNFNHVMQAKRQPGSAFKPFIYSAALAKGFTLASVINDAPIVIPDSGEENSLWRPKNDTGQFYGPTRLRIGLIKSRNLVSIRLLQLIGLPYAIDYATRFGFSREQLPDSLSLALGTAEVTPLQLAGGYAVFANGGYAVKPYFIDRIVNYAHKVFFQAKPLIAENNSSFSQDNEETIKPNIAPRVISPQNAYLITSVLRDVIKRGTAKGALVLHRGDLAGKTGTTNKEMDAWFSGFNSSLVATAWLGYDEPHSLYEYAVKSALPMWIDFMSQALKDQPEATMVQPPNIITARIDRTTGLLAQAGNSNTVFEVFRKRFLPKQQAAQNSADSENNVIAESGADQLY